MAEDYKKVGDVNRQIHRTVERELWARTAGRCQFEGCNRRVFLSPVTNEKMNNSEKAHIYAFSGKGPRAVTDLPDDIRDLNSIENLMLICAIDHKTIDDNKDQYPADLLLGWKAAHEDRIKIVSGIASNKKSHVLMYEGKVGEIESPLVYTECAEAMFPDRYPAEEKPVKFGMTGEHEDCDPEYWIIEENNLRKVFERKVRPLIAEADPNHFSVFGFAPQPLLILLGALITDKNPADVYQLHRDPRSCKWKESQPTDQRIESSQPTQITDSNKVALVFSVSGRIQKDLVNELLGDDTDIWEISFPEPLNTALRTKEQLEDFKAKTREALAAIDAAYPTGTIVNIFPAMPIPCAIELGRVRMPKANHPWKIYDKNPKTKGFAETITINPQK